jgi:hypothetical protein
MSLLGQGKSALWGAAATGATSLKTAANVKFELPDVLGRISRFVAVTH